MAWVDETVFNSMASDIGRTASSERVACWSAKESATRVDAAAPEASGYPTQRLNCRE